MRHFDRGHLYRVTLPMGGIGTGSVSLSGRGELCDWEIMNIPNKGALSGECEANGRSFFAIRAKGTKVAIAEEWFGVYSHPIIDSAGKLGPRAPFDGTE